MNITVNGVELTEDQIEAVRLLLVMGSDTYDDENAAEPEREMDHLVNDVLVKFEIMTEE